MGIYTIITILIVLSAFFGYINARFLKMPTTIGLMSITILFTLIIIALSYFGINLIDEERELISQIDFQVVLLDGMLSFLLFAGALHTSFQQLKVQRKPIIAFATIGTIISTFIIGVFIYYITSVHLN